MARRLGMSHPRATPQGSLGVRVAIGASWLLGMRWSVQLLGLGSTLVLARLLVPEDFGIVALATAYIAIVEGLTALPMSQALIRYRDADRSLYDTAWTLGLLRGVFIALLILASAVPVSNVMNEPRLLAVIMALAVRPLLEGLINPRFIDFDKHLDFSRPMMVRVGTKAIAVVVTVGLAIALRSYWALIIGGLVSASVRLPLTYAFKPYRPRLSIENVRTLISFSGWLSGASILYTLTHKLDKFVVGGLLNISMLGVYHIATQVSVLSNRELLPPLKRAFYPSFTMIAGDLPKLRANSLEAISILAAGTLALGVGLALVAEEFVTVVLSEKWLATVPIIAIWSPFLALRATGAVSDSVMMARHATHLIFAQSAISFVVRIGFIVVAISQFGFASLGYALAASELIFYVVQLFLLKNVLDMPIYEPLLAAWRSVISAAAMAAAVLGADGSISTLAASVPIILVMKVLLGAAVYISVHGALWLASGRPPGLEARLLGLWPLVAGRIRGRTSEP